MVEPLNVMNSHPEIVPIGHKEPRGLDVDLLKRDMADLWREAGTDDKESSVSRTCLATLVIPAGIEDSIEDRVMEIVQVFPSRTIVVRGDPSRAPGSVEARVSASCSKRPGSGALVCSESVNLVAGPDTDRHVASAVRSLAVGGVPVVILSEAFSPLEVPWVARLRRVSDLVVGDSERISVSRGLEFWDAIVADEGSIDYRDLLWARLIDWRRVIASWFDRRETRGSLKTIREVRVTVADSPGGTLKAWLLLGWLGSRLGWSVDGEVVLKVRRLDCEDSATVHSVAFEFGDGRPRVSWRRLVSEQAILVEEGKDSQVLFRLNQTKTDRRGAVVSMIQRYGPGGIAREAMAFACQLGERDGA